MISLDIVLVYCLNLLHVRDLHFSDRSKNYISSVQIVAMMAELYENDEYMPKAREALLEMLQESPGDLVICEILGKTLKSWDVSFPLEELREKYLKPTDDKRQELINLMNYVITIKEKTCKALLEIINRSSKHNSEDLIAMYVVAHKALSELGRMLCEKILDELDKEDTRLASDPALESL